MQLFAGILFFLASFTGFLSFFIIKLRNKERCIKCVNIYLGILILCASIRLFADGLFTTYTLSFHNEIIIIIDLFFASIGTVSCVFYFLSLIHLKKVYTKNFLAILFSFFCLCVLLYMLQIHQNFNWLFQIIKLTIHLSAIICLIYIIYLVYFYIWKINSDIEKVKGQNLVIKKWTVFISVCFFLILLIRILFINKSCAIIGADSYLITGIWLTAFVIIIIKQEILYGFDYLRIVIETVENNQKENIEEVAFKKIWEIESQVKDVETEKDLSLKNIVSPNLKEYIIKIEAISFGTDFFIKNSVSMEDLASELNLPASHIAYVFKFHSKVSFSEYKKIIRIQHAIKQLDTNYIKNNTLEALAFEVGFTSYTSFYTAFKNITGKSPQEYLR